MNTKKLLTWGAIGVGAYLAYRWYMKDRAKRLAAPAPSTGVAGTGGFRDQYDAEVNDSPRWKGYGRVPSDISQAKAFGAETGETMPTPAAPNAVIGDAEEAAAGMAFGDEDEFTETAVF